MKKLWIALILVLISTGQAFATAQMPETLNYKGQSMSLYSNPLESYFSPSNPRPRELFNASCSALWRGYRGSWKISGDVLYLVRLEDGNCGGSQVIELSKVFPGQRGPIKAKWFFGTLRIPQGKPLKRVHMGYRSVYEKDLLIRIEQGRVVDVKTVSNLSR